MRLRFQTKETVTDISRDLQISRSHLYVLERKYDEDPTMADKQREGCPTKVDEHLQRRIVRKIHQDSFQSSLDIANQVNTEMEEEKQICPSTVRNVAHSYGFKAYRALAKPPLDANQVTIVSFLMRHTSDSSQRTPAQGLEA